jgi:hypothetical protein
MPGYHVEAVGGGDRLAPVGLDDHLAAAVHRGVAVAVHRDQVREGHLDQAGLAGAGRAGQQAGTPSARSVRSASTSAMPASTRGR